MSKQMIALVASLKDIAQLETLDEEHGGAEGGLDSMDFVHELKYVGTAFQRGQLEGRILMARELLNELGVGY